MINFNFRDNGKPEAKEGAQTLILRRENVKSAREENRNSADFLEEYPTIEALIQAEAVKVKQ